MDMDEDKDEPKPPAAHWNEDNPTMTDLDAVLFRKSETERQK
jgi:hypothetical protein